MGNKLSLGTLRCEAEILTVLWLAGEKAFLRFINGDSRTNPATSTEKV
jgi:hypothetical protein